MKAAKLLLIAGILGGFLLCLGGHDNRRLTAEASAASPESGQSETHSAGGHAETSEHGSGGHGNEHGDEHGHHPPTPLSYYLDWFLVVLVFVVVVQKTLKNLEEAKHEAPPKPESHPAEEHHPPPMGIPLLLVSVVFFLFFFEGFSVLAHYHEPNNLGMLRFATKFISGILLMLYGLSFLHDH